MPKLVLPKLPALLLAAVLAASAAQAAPGDWPEPRQNAQLTGIQPMPGAMKSAPALLARFDLGRSQPSVTPVTLPDGTNLGLSLVVGRLLCFEQSGALRWESHPAGLNFSEIVATEDLNGDGSIEILLKAGRPSEPYGAAALVSLADGKLLWRYDVEPMSYAWYLYADHYLPGESSKQLIVIMHAYPPDTANGYMAFFAFNGGLPEQRWRYDFSEYTCFPSLLRTDLDGDGVQELAIETHSRMWFLDVASGQLKHFAKWDVSPANVRSYGLVKFADLDKDGREDFLCIATFAQHHEVLLNKGGTMEKAWSYGWPESVTTGKVASTWPEAPDVDVDGDGHIEIIVSMFNSEDESAWLTRIYDAVTGEMKYRIPGFIGVATADVNGDGTSELFGNASTDPTQTKLDGARLYAFREGAPVLLWEDPAGIAVKADRLGTLRVDKDGARWRLKAGPESTFTLEAWTKPPKPDRPDFSAVPALAGPATPKLLAANLVGDARNEIVMYQEPKATLLSVEGGAVTAIGEYTSNSLPVIADLDGDGTNELVLTEVAADHLPRVAAITPGKENAALWRTELPEAGRPGLPAPRIAYVRTARFTGQSTPDLYLWAGTPMVRSAALNGRTGEMIWDKGETPNIERYWGASMNLAAAWDVDGDGNEDLVFTNPDYYCVANGLNGEPLLGPLQPPVIFNQPSQGLYTLPAILDKSGDAPTVCLVAGHYFQGAMSLKAAPMWYKLPLAGEARCAEEGFARTADGAWLMGFSRQNGSFACINIADGAVRWKLPLEASGSDVATCDIDGDGNQEFVFGTSHGTLCAVAARGDAPKVLWQTTLSAGSGAPIIADVTGDGLSDVVVPTTDGYVNVFASNNNGQGRQ